MSQFMRMRWDRLGLFAVFCGLLLLVARPGERSAAAVWEQPTGQAASQQAHRELIATQLYVTLVGNSLGDIRGIQSRAELDVHEATRIHALREARRACLYADSLLEVLGSSSPQARTPAVLPPLPAASPTLAEPAPFSQSSVDDPCPAPREPDRDRFGTPFELLGGSG